MTLRGSLIPVVIKEFRQIRRDPTSLGMLMVLPAALIVLVGYALNFDVKHVPFLVMDQSRTSESREYVAMFQHSEYFTQLGSVDRYGEIEDAFLLGHAKIALVIPPDFGRDLMGSKGTKVQILVDGADANTGGQAMGYAVRMTMDYSNKILLEALRRMGRNVYIPIDLQPRIWYNPDMVTSRFLVPGLIGFIIMLTAVISTSLTVVREKERGTMEQIMVSPLRPIQVILGKTLPYMAIALVSATAILILGYLLFDIQIKGSMVLLYAGIMTLILASLGQGLLISSATDSQQVAFMASIFTTLLPSFLLSGFVFPIASMPV
ncbi:MAG TPA: ABC transporter permease, partial [Bacteroidota bacterium]|nr:ABC transporter permease [Bacteroidota bacterium]